MQLPHVYWIFVLLFRGVHLYVLWWVYLRTRLPALAANFVWSLLSLTLFPLAMKQLFERFVVPQAGGNAGGLAMWVSMGFQLFTQGVGAALFAWMLLSLYHWSNGKRDMNDAASPSRSSDPAPDSGMQ